MVVLVVMGVVMNVFVVGGVGGLKWNCEKGIELYRSSQAD